MKSIELFIFQIILYIRKDVIFIDLFKYINSLNASLERNTINNSFSKVDTFLTELKHFLHQYSCLEKLKTLPKNTIFSLDRYEGDYAVCENRQTGEMYDIPRSKVNPYAKDGDLLIFEDDLYQIYQKKEQKN